MLRAWPSGLATAIAERGGLSVDDQQNGADHCEDNEHAGERELYRGRSSILGRLVRHGAS